MFQFAGFPPPCLCVRHGVAGVCPAGSPHSDTCGSQDICSSPQLFAACRVFRRLLAPRHPPCALSRLTVALLVPCPLSRLAWRYSGLHPRHLCLASSDASSVPCTCMHGRPRLPAVCLPAFSGCDAMPLQALMGIPAHRRFWSHHISQYSVFKVQSCSWTQGSMALSLSRLR